MKKFVSMLPVLVVLFLISSPAFAAGNLQGDSAGYIGIGAGLAIGLAALGAAMGQGRASAAALEGIARNPNAADKIFTPMIIGLALMESIAIYGLLIAIFLNGQIG